MPGHSDGDEEETCDAASSSPAEWNHHVVPELHVRRAGPGDLKGSPTCWQRRQAGFGPRRASTSGRSALLAGTSLISSTGASYRCARRRPTERPVGRVVRGREAQWESRSPSRANDSTTADSVVGESPARVHLRSAGGGTPTAGRSGQLKPRRSGATVEHRERSLPSTGELPGLGERDAR